MQSAEILFAIVPLLGVSGLLLHHAKRDFSLWHAARRWPRLDGIVRSSSIYISRVRKPTHRPQFQVEYQAMGEVRTSLCESPTRAAFRDARGAEDVLARYPVGSAVSVFVDPVNHDRAFLWLPELHIALAELLGGMILLLVVVVGVLKARGVDLEALAVRILWPA